MIKALNIDRKVESNHIEPCMNCFKYFSYSNEDMVNGFIDGCTAKSNYIICPHCGKKTIIHGHSIALC